MQTNEILKNLDPIEIQKYQQNRYPCFFVDFIEEVVPGKYAKGYKNFTYNEWFFPAHFEDEPNVPGFIQIEALLQVFLMTFLTLHDNKGRKTADYSIKSKLRKKIIPGDKLEIISELHSYKRGIACGTSKGFINSELACEIELKVVVNDVLNQYIPQKLN